MVFGDFFGGFCLVTARQLIGHRHGLLNNTRSAQDVQYCSYQENGTDGGHYCARIANTSAPDTAAHHPIEIANNHVRVIARGPYVGARNSLCSQPAVSRDFIGSSAGSNTRT